MNKMSEFPFFLNNSLENFSEIRRYGTAFVKTDPYILNKTDTFKYASPLLILSMNLKGEEGI